jgi:hypothetical protein
MPSLVSEGTRHDYARMDFGPHLLVTIVSQIARIHFDRDSLPRAWHYYYLLPLRFDKAHVIVFFCRSRREAWRTNA